jgi:hypothetical protein
MYFAITKSAGADKKLAQNEADTAEATCKYALSL